QLAVLALKRLQTFALVARDTGLAAAVDVGLLDPLIERLRRAADLGRNRHDRRPLRGVLAAMLDHHPDGTLRHLGRKLRGSSLIRHGSSLSRGGASDKSGAVHLTS